MILTFSYFLSITLTLTTVFILHIKLANRVPKLLIYFVIPSLVAYISLLILELFFDNMNDTSDRISNYLDDKYLDNVRTTKFYNVYPMFIILFFIFMILLYLGLFN